MKYRYKLRVNLTITKEQTNDNADNEQTYWQSTQETLRIEEERDLGALDFLGVMKTLAALHDAIGAIQTPKPQPRILGDDVLAESGVCVNAMCSKHFGGPQDWNCQGKPYPHV